MGAWELMKVLEQTKRPDGESKAEGNGKVSVRQKSKGRAYFSLLLSDFSLRQLSSKF